MPGLLQTLPERTLLALLTFLANPRGLYQGDSCVSCASHGGVISREEEDVTASRLDFDAGTQDEEEEEDDADG